MSHHASASCALDSRKRARFDASAGLFKRILQCLEELANRNVLAAAESFSAASLQVCPTKRCQLPTTVSSSGPFERMETSQRFVSDLVHHAKSAMPVGPEGSPWYADLAGQKSLRKRAADILLCLRQMISPSG